MLNKNMRLLKDFNNSEEILVTPKKLKSKIISIRLPIAMLNNLKIIASKKGDIGYQQIIKIYIAEGLIKDNSKGGDTNETHN